MDDATFEPVYKQQTEYLDGLERAVAERTRELHAAYDALKLEIAERERAADEAIRAGSGWEQTFDAVSDLIAIVDNDHRIVRVNRAMAERLGMTPEECVGQACHVLMHGTDEPVPNCPHTDLQNDGRSHVVEVYERCLGGYFAFGAHPLKDSKGHVVGSVHAAHDITDRVQAEEALRKSETQQATILEAARTGIALLHDRVFQWVNAHMLELTGYCEEELLGQNARMLYETKGEYERVGAVKYKQIHEFGTGEIDTRWRRKNGSLVDVHLRSVALDPENVSAGIIFTATDITDRRRAEKALRQSEERYRSIFECSPEMIVLMDAQGTFVEANDRAAEWLGYRKEEYLGKHFSQLPLWSQEDKARLQHMLSRRARGKEIPPYEVEFIREDGKKLVGRIHGAVIKSDVDEVAHILLMVSDVSEQKETEVALRAARDRAQRYLDIAAVMFVALDDKGNVSLVNRRACEILGYQEEELLGKNWFEKCLAEQRREEVRRVYQKLMAGQLKPVEYNENPVLTRDGVERLVAWHNTILRDGTGRIIGTLSSGEDITERKRAIELLRQSQERFKNAAECASDLIYEWDTSTDHLEWYGDIDAALGYAAGEFPRTIEAWLAIIHPDDAPRLAAQVEHHQESCDPIETEYRIGHKDGTWRHWTDRGTAVVDENGIPRKYIGVCTDITERRLAEEKLRQRESEIAHLGRVHTVGEMATTLAHEINQPLSAISNYVRGINRRVKKGNIDFDQLSGVLDLISSEVDRVSGIISHMRQFVRKGEPHRSSADLGELIQGVMELVQADVRRSRIDVRLELDDDIPIVLVDPIQIEQVVVNVVRNAIESMSENSDHERTLRISTRLSADREVEIAVSDTGGGLDPNADAQVFDAFYTTKTDGLGMGLAISRSIIEAHGGRIWVAPNLPQGTIVQCTIPLPGEGD